MSKLLTCLQSLISALLNRVPECASPRASSYSSQQITSNGQQVNSPIDGWAALTVSNAASSSAYVSLKTPNGFSHQHSVSANGHSASLHVPVKKGEAVTVGFGGFGSNVWLNFFERIGGGINRLIALAQAWIWEGCLCLETSFSLLSERFVRWCFHVLQTAYNKQSHLASIQDPIPRLQTVLLELLGTVHSVKLTTFRVEKRFLLTVAIKTIKRLQFLLKKVIPSIGNSYRKQVRTQRFTSTIAGLNCLNAYGKEVCHA